MGSVQSRASTLSKSAPQPAISAEEKATAAAIFKKTRRNPYESIYGPSPYAHIQCLERRPKMAEAHRSSQPTSPPALPRVPPFDFAVVKPYRSSSRSTVVLVECAGVDGVPPSVVLKVYQHQPSKPATSNPFVNESTAYARLLAGGVCARGVVPRCYGWTELTPGQASQCTAMARADCSDPPSRGSNGAAEEPKAEPVWRALLIEHLENAEHLGVHNITEDLAAQVMDAVSTVHCSGVMHADLWPRNILVVGGRRVVIIDFDIAACAGSPRYEVRGLLEEKADLWALLYQRLLPDKLAGIWNRFYF